MRVQRVGIIRKRDSLEAIALGQELETWLAARGIAVAMDQVEQDHNLLVILGGDGTLLHVAEDASRFRIPVVGVNLGGLGFLTEIEVGHCFAAIESILAGDVTIDSRMILRARLRSSGMASEWRHGLNDVVISKADVDRLVELSSWANEEYIATYRADGLILSTPTGSTAYNLSAGGPIVHPRLRALLVTPICPFMLESRPILLPDSLRLSVTMASESGSGVKVIVDGQYTWSMGKNSVLEIEVATEPLQLISSPLKGYFAILRRKLNWGGKTVCPYPGRNQNGGYKQVR